MKNSLKKFNRTLISLSLFFAGTALANEMTSFSLPQNYKELEYKKIKNISFTDEQAIGSYAKGSLKNATAMDLSGFGFIKIAQPRNRHWGTRDLVEVLEQTARWMASLFPNGERLQISDLSARHGGKITRHASHQNGLDVDLSPLRRDRREQDPMNVDGFDEEFVVNGKVTKNFDTERNWELVKAFFRFGDINRIFIDGKLKDEMCRWARDNDDWNNAVPMLRRLRHWPHHGNHFHLRLKCPAGSPRCVPQKEPPEGSGCSFDQNSEKNDSDT